MGTRAIISFRDVDGTFNVYQHWDGDPDTVIANILGTFATGKCWDYPRWEADEFAAAYIATNKTDGGNIRIGRDAIAYGDLSYSYVVESTGFDLKLTCINHYDNEQFTRVLMTDEAASDAA